MAEGAVPEAPLLDVSGVGKRFNALVVLDDINFAMRGDEAIGIVGPNGAGKTTFGDELVGAHPPSHGSIRFRGTDVTRLSAADRCRRGVIRTHQVPRPFSGMTVFENVFTAATSGGGFARDAADQRAIDSLALCGMTRGTGSGRPGGASISCCVGVRRWLSSAPMVPARRRSSARSPAPTGPAAAGFCSTATISARCPRIGARPWAWPSCRRGGGCSAA